MKSPGGARTASRQSLGRPYARLSVILGAVALATALCALIFQWAPVRRRFGIAEKRSSVG